MCTPSDALYQGCSINCTYTAGYALTNLMTSSGNLPKLEKLKPFRKIMLRSPMLLLNDACTQMLTKAPSEQCYNNSYTDEGLLVRNI